MASGSSFSKADELVSLWEYLRAQGRDISAAELCSEAPELVEEVGRQIAALVAMGPLLDPTGPSADRTESGPPPGPGAPGGGRRTSARSVAEFEDLQFHAEGGLGEVFRARHVELGREVALKFLKQARAGDLDGRRRFAREAAITGRLEHPGIVPIYALGLDDAGAPCYAMRFIRGETLGRAIADFHEDDRGAKLDPTARALALRDLLGRFTSACNTVAYAHSRGTIHRDLKPSNVMLGPFGETLVVDWGLARPAAADDSDLHDAPDPTPTEGGPIPPTAGVIGTPQYMSPEQAEARHDAVGPASDVYSLGATLYVLLTGKPPFADSKRFDELLDRVKSGDFPAPRAVHPGIPPALDAICRKAMATRPEDRYPSALDLARDVDRWLADEPVSAWSEPFATRARRWVRRHRTAVSVAAATTVVTSVGLAILAVTLTAANKRERDARDMADRQRNSAIASYRLAQEAVDDYFIQVSQGRLLNVPGLQPLRRQLLESAGNFYRRFAEERGDDPAVRAELGQVYTRMAAITAETGSKPEAVELARQGLEILEPLARAAGSTFKLRQEYASARGLIGTIHAGLRRADLAESELREAIRAWEALARERPADPVIRLGRAGAGAALGELYQATDRIDKAEEALRAALASLDALDPRAGGVGAASQRGRILHDLGQLRVRVGQFGPAEVELRRALGVIEPIARNHSEDLMLQFDLAKSRLAVGEAREHLGHVEEAAELTLGGLEVMERLARENPTVGVYQAQVGAILADLGRRHLRFGRRDLAADNLRRALALLDGLVATHPQVPDHRNELARILTLMAYLHSSAGRWDLAEPLNRRAVEIGRQLARDHANVGTFGDALGTNLHAGISDKLRTAPEAPGSLEKVVEDTRRAARQHPRIVQYRKSLASTLNTLGEVYRAGGRARDAEQAWLEAIAEWREVIKIEPDVPEDRYELSRALSNLAAFFITVHQFDRARPFAEESLTWIEPLGRAQPGDLVYAESLGTASMNAGKVDDSLGNPRGARGRYDLSIRTLEEVLRRDGELAQAKVFLGNAHFNRSLLRVKGRDPRGAFEEMEGASRDAPPELLQSFAGMYAIISAAASDPNLAPPPPVDVGDLGERAARRAVALLAALRDAGRLRQPGSRRAVMAYPLFEGLRSRDDFRKLVESIEEDPAGTTPPARP